MGWFQIIEKFSITGNGHDHAVGTFKWDESVEAVANVQGQVACYLGCKHGSYNSMRI